MAENAKTVKPDLKRTRLSSSDEEYTLDSRFKRLEELICKNFSDLQAEISGFRVDTNESIRDLKKDIDDLKTSVGFTQKECDDLKAKNQQLETKVSAAEMKISELNAESEVLKTKITKLEDYSRRENLRIYNVQENEDEECIELVAKIFDLMVGRPPGAIHAAHRLGKVESMVRNEAEALGEASSFSQRPRPIIIRFVSRQERDIMWRNRFKIKESEEFKNVFLDEDLSQTSARRRKALRNARRIAKEKGLASRITGDKIVINGIQYSYERLPDEYKK